MTSIKTHLRNAWQKVCSVLNNEKHDKSIFHLSEGEHKALADDYALARQFTYAVNRYAPSATVIPTQNYKVTHFDGSDLTQDEITALEQRLNKMRNAPNNNAGQPKL
ncbi:MAG: hypothetical protein NZ828_04910 [Alphaproteobacteria bacterium]|nr:hypothetical protein [Alphaproteobacteria bacterium]